MRFLLSNGEHMKTQVSDLPFASEFTSSSLLVVCANDNNKIVAACGIRGLLNTLVLYVREDYRSRGVGSQTLNQTIKAARERGLDFVTLTVDCDNTVAFRLYDRLGFKEVVSLKRSNQILMMLPLTYAGRLLFNTFSAALLVFPEALLFQAHRWLYRITT